jgi:cationic peptide transport system substrate-binding protein
MKRIMYVVLIGAALGVCGCQDQHAIKKQGLVYCADGSPSHFNPQLSSSATVLDITSRHLYDRLVEIDPVSQQIVGGLAESWTISKDRKRYQFHLRRGVAFHYTPYFIPTRPLNADDVLFSFNRILNPNHPYHAVSGGEYPFFDNIGFSRSVKAVRRINDATVEFELYDPSASFISSLATESAVILSAEYGQQQIEQHDLRRLDTFPIGTGPFKFVENRSDHYVRYTRHWRYWRGGAPLNKLVFDITPNPSTRLAKLLTGQCDIMAQPAALQLNVLEERDDLMPSIEAGANTAYLALNTQMPLLTDVNVRRAIAQSIDKQRIIDSVYLNTGDLASNVLPPASWAYRASVPADFNPNHGRLTIKNMVEQLPESARRPLTLWVLNERRSYNPNPRKMAELLQHDFALMGLSVTIETYDWNVLRRKLKNDPSYDLLLIGWIANSNDPDGFFRQQFSCDAVEYGSNYARWCDRGIDRLIDSANHTDQLDERIRLYHQIQDELEQQVPVIPLAHAYKLYAYNTSIEGISWPPYGGISFSQAFRK